MTVPAAQLSHPERLPDEILVYRPTRRDIDPETGQTTAAALESRHDWQSRGACWLWCERVDIEVTWIGSVTSSGMQADLYACRHCLFHLDQRVWYAQHLRDLPRPRAHGPPTPRGRHRRSDRR